MKKFVALKVVAKASEDADVVDLELMNEIIHNDYGGWIEGSTATAMRAQLKGKSPKNINVLINSYGGVASEGVAMYNILRQSAEMGAKVNVTVLGIAASAASIVAMAGDTIKVATGAQLMIHKAGMMGYIDFSNANDMRKYADQLEKLDGELASIYAARSGGKADKQKFLDLMAEETYLSGEEAIGLGIATETDASLQAVACIGSELLRNMGLRGINTAKGASTEPVATAETHNKENNVKLEELIAKFPEHAQALREEGRSQAKSDVDAAVAAERARIQACLDAAMPGHEETAQTMAFDGKSTAGDVALVIVAKEKKTRATLATNMRTEAPKPVASASSASGAGEEGQGGGANLSLEERAQKSWDTDPSLRKDFDEFKDYLAFEKGKASGNVNLYTRKEA